MAQNLQRSSESAARPPQSVLIVRLSAMGDVIHSLPAVSALRRARPELRIGWLIEERWAELLCSRESEREARLSPLKPLVEVVHIANFAGWSRALLSDETWHEVRSSFRALRGTTYDAVLDLQGAIRSAVSARMARAHIRIGASQPRESPSRLFYTRAIDAQGTHVIEQALSLASAVAGRQLEYVEPAFPFDPKHEAWAEQFLKDSGGAQVAMINPGAGWGAKCWPAESFGAVACALHNMGLTVLINHGPGEEALAHTVHQASGQTARLLKCSVGELIAITRRIRLFIGGDTGPMHLAAALGVPVVALFGPTPPERTGPYGSPSIVLRSPRSIVNSSHSSSPDEGLAEITPGQVITAANELLGAVLG